MPSNKDLTDEILKINPAAVVDGLNNMKLEAYLASLKGPVKNDPVVNDPAKQAAEAADVEEKRAAKAKLEAQREAKAQAEANAAAEAVLKGRATHKLVEGKAVTTMRGIVFSGDPEHQGGGRVSARDFHQKEDDVSRLVDDGVLVKL